MFLTKFECFHALKEVFERNIFLNVVSRCVGWTHNLYYLYLSFAKRCFDLSQGAASCFQTFFNVEERVGCPVATHKKLSGASQYMATTGSSRMPSCVLAARSMDLR